ncbi:MAG: hypothetical protein WD825_17340 [Gemmatimonadaceae bacterium]
MTKATGSTGSTWATSPFIYRGPTSGATLRREGHEPFSVMLYDGATVDVPCDHPHIESLVAQRLLTPVVPAEPAVAATPPAATTRSRSSSRTEPKETNS